MGARKPKFKMGDVVITEEIDRLIKSFPKFKNYVCKCVERHSECDWGNMEEAEKKENRFAIKHGERIFSAYKSDRYPNIFVVTERDRSITTVLCAEEWR